MNFLVKRTFRISRLLSTADDKCRTTYECDESSLPTGMDVGRQKLAHYSSAVFCDDDPACFGTACGVHFLHVRGAFHLLRDCPSNFILLNIRFGFNCVSHTFLRSYARELFTQPQFFGVGEPRPLLSFDESLNAISNKRNTLIFVHNGFLGGDTEMVISTVAEPAKVHGNDIRVLSSEDDMSETCRSNFRGVSSCIAAAVFHSSPTEGPYGMWNYTIRADADLSSKVNVRKGDNGAELYLFPFQHAIDWAIAQTNGKGYENTLPEQVRI